jgi:DNA-binding transcriptional LysR family regulator
MDSLGSLNAFVQAAEARSFTVAGRQLGVSSSAIGKAVARMEERLGVRLFHRSTRSIALTAEGALFLERCRRIFSEIEAAELEITRAHEAPRGTLRVSLSLAGMLMMPTLVAFMRAYPEIVLDLDFSDRVVDVIEEGFDAVVRFAEVGDSSLMSRALGTYRRRLVAAPAYLTAKGVPLTSDDLRAHLCLLHRFPTSRRFERWPLGPEHAGIEAELPKRAVASTLEPLIYMAEQGLGIAYVPDFAIARQLREGRLVTVLNDYTDLSGPLRVLWPSSRHLAPKLRVFVDFLAANLVPVVEGEGPLATS